MKKQRPTKEDFRRLEYEFNESKEYLPGELVEVLEQGFDLYRSYIILELPLREDLKPVIRNLMSRHYPAIGDFDQLWQLKWLDEIASANVYQLGFDMTQLFTAIEAKQELSVPENFESMIRLYARPKQPFLSTMDDYKDWVLTDEQRQAIEESLAESNRFETEQCEEINQLKTEYINEVQPLIFKYFGTMIDDMTTEMWNHYGINLGFAYSQFANHCLDLLYELITKELTEDPGMRFFDYRFKKI